ncbi:MAG: dihydroorotase [Pseudomonadota bacterium]
MIQIKNAQTPNGVRQTLNIQSQQEIVIDATNLLLLPGLIDPHVHFRTPGLEYKEDWRTAAKASIKGGYTTVFDMPNTIPPTVTEIELEKKIALIDSQLKDVKIPLHYHLFFGADKHHLNEIKKVKAKVIGIKVFMGCSTGGLVIDDDESLHAIFKLAATENMLVAVHAEDEHRLQENIKKFNLPQPYAIHSQIRDEIAASIAVKKAIDLVRLYGTRLYILHTSTCQEVELIAQAKAEGLPVFAETTPHHLFLSINDYDHLQGKAVMNPPLRALAHQKALFQAINDGVIDTIGSDHAPHTLEEKARPYGACPSGVPGIETTLPLLLEAYHQGLLSLEKIIDLTYHRAKEIFSLATFTDYVLVDLQEVRVVKETNLKTKCQWSPFAGCSLSGWPVYTILNSYCYDLSRL